jgi:hypothetical protein
LIASTSRDLGEKRLFRAQPRRVIGFSRTRSRLRESYSFLLALGKMICWDNARGKMLFDGGQNMPAHKIQVQHF